MRKFETIKNAKLKFSLSKRLELYKTLPPTMRFYMKQVSKPDLAVHAASKEDQGKQMIKS